jgi:hypothetical protein
MLPAHLSSSAFSSLGAYHIYLPIFNGEDGTAADCDVRGGAGCCHR